MKPSFFRALVTLGLIISGSGCLAQTPAPWKLEWPNTDFSRSSVDLSEIISGGPPKDGIPAIDTPRFMEAGKASEVGGSEPVIYLKHQSEVKAYPFRVLMWHEIVNDTIGGLPVTVTYCPLCNAAVVFDRRIDGRVYDFGVSGKLRHSDMIMYDRQTESWWQQFTGAAIVGEMTGTGLARLPARVIPFREYQKLYPDGEVLVSHDPRARPYGENPYVNYDSSRAPFLYKGRYQGPGSPMSYVVSVGQNAWLLSDLRRLKQITHEDLLLKWSEGMSSPLDSKRIDQGRDIGYVSVERTSTAGSEEIVYDMTFAFVFMAFNPEGVIHEL